MVWIAVEMFCYSEKVEAFFFVFLYFSSATSIGLIYTSGCILMGLNAYILKQSMVYNCTTSRQHERHPFHTSFPNLKNINSLPNLLINKMWTCSNRNESPLESLLRPQILSSIPQWKAGWESLGNERGMFWQSCLQTSGFIGERICWWSLVHRRCLLVVISIRIIYVCFILLVWDQCLIVGKIARTQWL